jgi:hypothetical protein
MWDTRNARQVFHHVMHANGDVDIVLDGEPYACVRDSCIAGAGKGLFTCRDLAKGTRIGIYAGAVMGWVSDVRVCDLTSEYITSLDLYINAKTDERYVIVVDGKHAPQKPRQQLVTLGLAHDYIMPCEYIAPFDVSDWPGAFVHMANDADGSSGHGLVNNCILQSDGVFYATRYVPGTSFDEPDKRASELLHPYGPIYWTT